MDLASAAEAEINPPPIILVTQPAIDLPAAVFSFQKPLTPRVVLYAKINPIEKEQPSRKKSDAVSTDLCKHLLNISLEQKAQDDIDNEKFNFPYDQNSLRMALGNSNYQLNALKKIREFLCGEDLNSNTDEILKLDLLNYLEKFLDPSLEEDLQYETCWCITNMAAGKTEYVIPIVKYGVVEKLINLIQANNQKVRHQAAWALGNIAGDSEEHRNYVMNIPGIIDYINQLFTANYRNNVRLRVATWIVANLARWGKDWEKLDIAVPFLVKIITNEIDGVNEAIVAESLWALGRIYNIRPISSITLITPDFVKHLIKKLRSGMNRYIHTGCSTNFENSYITIPALRCFINLTAEEENGVGNFLIENGILNELKWMLSSSQSVVSKTDCALIISNLAAGSLDQAHAVCNHGLIQLLTNGLKKYQSKKYGREVCYAFSNISMHRDTEQIYKLVEFGTLEEIVKFAAFDFNPDTDLKVVKIIRDIVQTFDKNVPYLYSAKPKTDNPMSLVILERGLCLPLLDILRRNEPTEEDEDDDIFPIPKTPDDLIKLEIVKKLKELFSKFFPEQWLKYCEEKQTLEELLYGMEAVQLNPNTTENDVLAGLMSIKFN